MESDTHFVSGRISAFTRRSNITQHNLDHSQLAEAFLIPSALRYVSSALSGKYLLDLVIDGGPCQGDRPSTVIDCTIDPPKILRLGAVSREEIERVLDRKVD